MNLGEKIKKIRELKGLTQLDIAEKLSVTQSSYSKMEIGTVDIPFTKLEQIAIALNVSVEQILGFSDQMVFNINHNKKGQGLVINQVSRNEKKIYDEYIESLKAENTFLKSTIEKLLGNKQTIKK